MIKHGVTIKQVMMMAFVGLMSPAIRVLPGRTASLAGNAGWLSPLLAIIPAVLLALILCDLLKEDGSDLASVMCSVLGNKIGRVINAIFVLWMLVLLSVLVRVYGERLLSSTYQGEPVQLFIVILLVMVLYAGRKELRMLAGAGQVFFWVLAIVLIVVFLFSSLNIEKENLLPVTYLDIGSIAKGILPTLNVLSCAVLICFLGGDIKRDAKDKSKLVIGTICFCIVYCLLEVVSLGNFGVSVLERMQVPFFMVIKGIKIFDTFERIESLVESMWLFTDFLLITFLVMACCRAFSRTFKMEQSNILTAPVVLTILSGSILIAPDYFNLEWFSESILQPFDVAICFGFIPLVWIIYKIREKKGKKGIDKRGRGVVN